MRLLAAALTAAGLLVGHGHVAEHRDPETARAVAKEHLEVRIDEHHHRVNELLGHRKLDAVELGAFFVPPGRKFG
jgi:hypothetical protein